MPSSLLYLWLLSLMSLGFRVLGALRASRFDFRDPGWLVVFARLSRGFFVGRFGELCLLRTLGIRDHVEV